MAETTPVKHFNVWLELPNTHTICTLQGDDLGNLKEMTNTMVKGGCRFEPFGSSNTLLVYNPTDGGKTPIGWIAGYEIPEALSNRGLVGRGIRQVA
ncbi:MAG: hypothetical protein ABSG07_22145 [Terriglobales bacterium]|jgi:hypothetical protein